MSRFRRQMSGDTVRKGVVAFLDQCGGGGGDDIAIENNGEAMSSSSYERARDCRYFPAAELAEDFKTVGKLVLASRQSLIDYSRFAADAVGVEAGSRTRPVSALSAECCCGDSGSGAGIADTHFTKDEKVCDSVDGSCASVDGGKTFFCAHGRFLRPVVDRMFQVEGNNVEFEAEGIGEGVDSSAAALEICHHLLCDFRRIGRNATFCYPVIACKYDYLHIVGVRKFGSLPTGKPDSHIFKAPKGALWLCKTALPGSCQIGGVGVWFAQVVDGSQELIGRIEHFYFFGFEFMATAGKINLILGGARSGKSQYAEEIVEASGLDKVYLATGQAEDEEMRARIDLHQARRNSEWTMIETKILLADALSAEGREGRIVLVDCLTFWLSNLLMEGLEVEAEFEKLLKCVADVPARLVFVSSEVGLSIVPENALARAFRDYQGILNQKIAAIADKVVFVAAGLPVVLKTQK